MAVKSWGMPDDGAAFFVRLDLAIDPAVEGAERAPVRQGPKGKEHRVRPEHFFLGQKSIGAVGRCGTFRSSFGSKMFVGKIGDRGNWHVWQHDVCPFVSRGLPLGPLHHTVEAADNFSTCGLDWRCLSTCSAVRTSVGQRGGRVPPGPTQPREPSQRGRTQDRPHHGLRGVVRGRSRFAPT